MTDLTKLRNEIMQEVYEEAEPDDWYSQHYLSSEREQEIFDKHTQDVDLTSSEHAHLALVCITSLGPTNHL